jgi:fatty acid desaturase
MAENIKQPKINYTWQGAEQKVTTQRVVSPDIIKELSGLKPAIPCTFMLLDWVSIVAVILICQAYWNIGLYCLAVAFIAARMVGLTALLHDGAHYRLFKTRILNDLVSDIFCAWPVGITTNYYRRVRHFQHHQNIGLPDDPHIWQTYRQNSIWNSPRTKLGLLTHLFVVMVKGPYASIRGLFRTLRYEKRARSSWLRVIYYLAIAAAIAYFDLYKIFFMYWVVPWAILFPVIHEFRLMAEHFGLQGQSNENGSGTRTTITNWFEKVFLISHNLNYHAEHHLYPSVPFFNLPKLHKLLTEKYSDKIDLYVTKGYWRVFNELTDNTRTRWIGGVTPSDTPKRSNGGVNH